MHQLYYGLLIAVFAIFWCLVSDRGQTKKLLKTGSAVGWTLYFVWDVYMYLRAMLLAVELFWLLTIKSTSFVTARCSEKKKKNKTYN